jgi:L-lactate dehydrogenase complex protein LldG
MKDSTNREKVLKKIRDAIIDKSDNPFQNIDFESSVYYEINDSLDITFAEAFNEANGNFVYCSDEKEFLNNYFYIASSKKWENIFCVDDDLIELLELSKIKFSSDENNFLLQKIGITRCEFLIARSGSIMVSSKQMSGRKMNFYPDTHIVIAYTSQLVDDMKQALKQIRLKYPTLPSMISIICGPSRNIEIENTTIIGSHGPKEVYVFLIDNLIQ